MVLVPEPGVVGVFVGCWRFRAGHQDSAGTAGYSFSDRKEGRV